VQGNIAGNDSSIFLFASRPVAKVLWSATGTLPTSVNSRYYSGQSHSQYPSGSASASYWTIGVSGGSGYEYTPVINYTPHETGSIVNSNATTRLAYFNAQWLSLAPVSAANTQSVPQQAFTTSPINQPLSSTSAFTLTDSLNPLPVTLLKFTGARQGQHVLLQWITGSEENNSHFVVERSLDSRLFTAIGKVEGAGSKATPTTYQLTDAAIPVVERLYYRLRQVDADGRFTFSEIVPIAFDREKRLNFSVYPNPCSGVLLVEGMESGNLEIFDVAGMAVGHLQVTSGRADVSALAPGMYFLREVSGSGVHTARLVKE
jgi:hypothetical protein